jgi:hypothetical protein
MSGQWVSAREDKDVFPNLTQMGKSPPKHKVTEEIN